MFERAERGDRAVFLHPEFKATGTESLDEFQELARSQRGKTVPTDAELPDEVESARDRAHEAWVEVGGWYMQELEFTMRYRPSGHADPFLRAWLDLTSAPPQGAPAVAASRVVAPPPPPSRPCRCSPRLPIYLRASMRRFLRMNWWICVRRMAR